MMRNKCIIYGIEALLVVFCSVIGFFEDAFILGAFVITTVINILIAVFYKKLTGDGAKTFIFNMIFEWAAIIFVFGLFYTVWMFFAGYEYYGLFGVGEGTVYKGLDALLNNIFYIIICFPAMTLSAIYILVYSIIALKKQKNEWEAEGDKKI